MENWARNYRKILEESGLKVFMMAGYVDDGRQITSTFIKGMRYSTENKIFQSSPEAEIEDQSLETQGETANQRMARICKVAMNQINMDLVFTTESQEDFAKERLPTLDFEMWISNNKVRHSYYQKPMKTPYVIMERSGMGHQQKFCILSNELCRRMSNIQISEVPHSEILEIIEQYIGELRNSGYSCKQAKEINNSGLKGWKIKSEKERKIISLFIDMLETQ